jgi:16S rRNA (uracil1498-N3)-methyltransferase
LVEPDAAAGAGDAREAFSAKPAAATLLVGPEGGWSAEEVSEARLRGYLPWTLGPRTLRADAAGLVGLAVLLGRWGEF